MNVLITGGNGFIGSHLAEKLARKNIQVSLLDLFFNRNTKDLDCEKIKGDICDCSIIQEAVMKKDVIVHLAAISRVEWGQLDPNKCLKVNTEGTLKLMEAIRKKNPRGIVIMGSSREVYGEPLTLPVTEDHPKNPISVYGASKLASEKLLSVYHNVYGLNYVILRFSNVYGSPRDVHERVTPKFMSLALKGQPLTVYGGQQVLDFTFIDDVIEGIISVIEKVAEGSNDIISQDLQLTSGKGTSILELAGLIKKICESDSKIMIKSKRSFDVSKFVGSYEKAKRFLNYMPKHTLSHGLMIYKERIQSE